MAYSTFYHRHESIYVPWREYIQSVTPHLDRVRDEGSFPPSLRSGGPPNRILSGGHTKDSFGHFSMYGLATLGGET